MKSEISRLPRLDRNIAERARPDILCVGRGTDTGYAWLLIERFWEGIAKTYPGRVAVCFRRMGALPHRLLDAGVQIIEHDWQLGTDATMNFVRAGGYRHLYLSDQPDMSLHYARLRLAGVRNIIAHSHYTPGELLEATGVKRLAKTILGRIRPITANAYIAVSDVVMRKLTHRSCLPAGMCHLAENGIDLDTECNATDIRAELGLPANAVVVVSSSRAHPHKRVHLIIEAARKTVGAYFIHCGDGPDMPALQDLVRQYDMEKRFFLLGRRSDVSGILASADIAVHASAGEVGTSLAILEFQRAGLAIVLPNIDNIIQSVTPGESALLYGSGDVDALAARLRLLISDPKLRRSLGAAARANVQRYDVRRTIERVSQIVGSVIDTSELSDL